MLLGTYLCKVIILLPSFQLPSVRIDVSNSLELNHIIETNKNLFYSII